MQCLREVLDIILRDYSKLSQYFIYTGIYATEVDIHGHIYHAPQCFVSVLIFLYLPKTFGLLLVFLIVVNALSAVTIDFFEFLSFQFTSQSGFVPNSLFPLTTFTTFSMSVLILDGADVKPLVDLDLNETRLMNMCLKDKDKGLVTTTYKQVELTSHNLTQLSQLANYEEKKITQVS